MWQDALRVCRDYIPNKLSLLQEEYDREMATESTKFVDFFLCHSFENFHFLALCWIIVLWLVQFATDYAYLLVFAVKINYK